MSVTDNYTASNNWMSVNSELERMCEGMGMASFKILFRHGPANTEENHKEHQPG
jgi:hypothetical protein